MVYHMDYVCSAAVNGFFFMGGAAGGGERGGLLAVTRGKIV